jgi:hypothetical protein
LGSRRSSRLRRCTAAAGCSWLLLLLLQKPSCLPSLRLRAALKQRWGHLFAGIETALQLKRKLVIQLVLSEVVDCRRARRQRCNDARLLHCTWLLTSSAVFFFLQLLRKHSVRFFLFLTQSLGGTSTASPAVR